MIGAPVAVDAGQARVVINRIAGDGMAVARNRDDVGRVFLTVQINHKARYVSENAGEGQPRT